MSTSSRIVSGSLASWARIGVTFVTQLLLVPVYLSYWSPELYGLWLSVLAFVAIWTTLDFGHAEYLGFEFLKLGRSNRDEISLRLWSSIGLAFGVGLIELTIIGLIVYYDLAGILLGDISIANVNVMRDSGLVIMALYFAWLTNGYIAGILQRALYPFGYYPRTSWWAVGNSVIVSAAPIVAIIMGADLLKAGLALAFADVIYNLVYWFDLVRLARVENIWFKKIQLSYGFKDYRNSLVLSGKSFLEKLRHQGIRVILAPLSGAGGVAAFSTMRTGANVALQGLSTITNPMLPELMRFLNQQDQQRTEAVFGMVWMVVILLAPAVVILQVFVEPLYIIWTRDSISFDPLLFGLLSLGVLIYGLAQPPISVIRGNNLLKPQLLIAMLASVIVVGGMFLLVPVLGILGAAIALLASEIIVFSYFSYIAKRWLGRQEMVWPKYSFRIAVTSVWMAGMAMAVIVFYPLYQWAALAVAFPLFGWNIWHYWKSLPAIASSKVRGLINCIPFINRFV